MDAIEKMSQQLTKQEAIELAETGWWQGLDAKTVVRAQLGQDRLCMDFSEFHRMTEEALGRPVWTHEFIRRLELLDELETGHCERGPLQKLAQILVQPAVAK